jgi:hypothetical protein
MLRTLTLSRYCSYRTRCVYLCCKQPRVSKYNLRAPLNLHAGFGFWEGEIDLTRDVEEVLWYDEQVKLGTAKVRIHAR